MSDAADAATVRILLADFANADSASKLNIIGGGICLIGFDPNLRSTIPHPVVCQDCFPAPVRWRLAGARACA